MARTTAILKPLMEALIAAIETETGESLGLTKEVQAQRAPTLLDVIQTSVDNGNDPTTDTDVAQFLSDQGLGSVDQSYVVGLARQLAAIDSAYKARLTALGNDATSRDPVLEAILSLAGEVAS